jgi:predicted dehydrogenase
MERRIFLGSALFAQLSAATSSDRPVKIGFLGGSHSHAKGKVDVVRRSSDFEIVGMWEDDPDLRAEYARDGIRQVTLDELLNDPSIQVIAVETPVRDHARHASMVLEAGKHVHIEKPPALDVESLRSVLNLAKRKKRIVQMGYMWRHHPGINAMLDAARQGWLGDIHMVRATINNTLAADRRPEWAEFRGGHMFELGPHVIDPIVRLLGRPERVTPYLKKHGKFHDNLADTTLAVLEFPDAVGLVVGVSMQPNSGRYRTFQVQGSLGTATLRPIEPPKLEIDLAKAAGPYPKGPHIVELPSYERYVDDMAELAAAVRGERSIAVTPAEDLMVQETLIRASGME